MNPVVNKYKVDLTDKDVLYIGRGSKWGNQYSHKEGTKALYKVATRAEAIQKYRLTPVGRHQGRKDYVGRVDST